MMKLGTPVADEGPGSASTKPGLSSVGVPSGLRSGVRRPRRRSGELSSASSGSTRPWALRTFSCLRSTRTPELVRSWGEPPPALGDWGAAGSSALGAALGTVSALGAPSALGEICSGCVGGAGVVSVCCGAGAASIVSCAFFGGGTISPGSCTSWMVLPGGTSTVTCTISPLGRRTQTSWGSARDGIVSAVRAATSVTPAATTNLRSRVFILAVSGAPSVARPDGTDGTEKRAARLRHLPQAKRYLVAFSCATWNREIWREFPGGIPAADGHRKSTLCDDRP